MDTPRFTHQPQALWGSSTGSSKKESPSGSASAPGPTLLWPTEVLLRSVPALLSGLDICRLLLLRESLEEMLVSLASVLVFWDRKGASGAGRVMWVSEQG